MAASRWLTVKSIKIIIYAIIQIHKTPKLTYKNFPNHKTPGDGTFVMKRPVETAPSLQMEREKRWSLVNLKR